MKNATIEKFENGIVYAKGGIPFSPRIFPSDRLSLHYAEDGATQIEYISDRGQTVTDIIMLEDVFAKMQWYIRIGDERFLPDYSSCKVYPFGVEATFPLRGHRFTFRIAALKEQVVALLTVPDGVNEPVGLSFSFYDSNCFLPTDTSDFRYLANGGKRTWHFDDAVSDGNYHFGFIAESNGQTVPLAMTIYGDTPLTQTAIGVSCSHHREVSLCPGGKGTRMLAIKFDDAEPITDGLAAFKSAVNDTVKAAKAAPILHSEYPGLDHLLKFIPAYENSLKCSAPYHGAMRAKNTNYWIWTWDNITFSEATALMGDAKYLWEELSFFSSYADPRKGVFHYMPLLAPDKIDLSKIDYNLPSTALCVILLYNAYKFTHDKKKLDQYYPMVVDFVNIMLSRSDEMCGMIRGMSLYPDFPHLTGEKGNDFSTFNNAIFYCAYRAMEQLAVEKKDTEYARKISAVTDKMEKNFRKMFFDEEAGFSVVSISSETGEQRKTHYANSYKAETDFFFDADGMSEKESIDGRILDFYKKNLVTRSGLRPIALHDPSYDGDGNQLHYWFGPTGGHFVRLAAREGDKEMMEKYIEWVSYWGDRLMCPEGVNCHVDTKDPPLDGWTCLNGSVQAFTMRTWYRDIVDSLLGLHMDDGELTLMPTDLGDYVLENLSLPCGKITVKAEGKGKYLAYFTVDGMRYDHTCKVPKDVLHDGAVLTFRRTSRAPRFQLIEGVGATLLACKKNTMTLSLAGTSFLRFRTDRPEDITTDHTVERLYRDGILTLKLRTEKRETVTVRF